MAHSPKLRQAEQVADELERRTNRLSEQLSQITASFREILDYLDAIEQHQLRLPSVDELRETADALREVADAKSGC